MPKCQKSRIICYAKNVENPATFAEGFWPEFQARGRFMKYSMSAQHAKQPSHSKQTVPMFSSLSSHHKECEKAKYSRISAFSAYCRLII